MRASASDKELLSRKCSYDVDQPQTDEMMYCSVRMSKKPRTRRTWFDSSQ